MRKILQTLKDRDPTLSNEALHARAFPIIRGMTGFTVKGMAMDQVAMEQVIRFALREGTDKKLGLTGENNHTTPLTTAIQELFRIRTTELATSVVNVPELQSMLTKRDHSTQGSSSRGKDIDELTRHLCNELNNLNPCSTPV